MANSSNILALAVSFSALLLLLAVTPYNATGQTLEQGYDAFERGDTTEALTIWHTLAEQGNATAQLNLGQLYRLGKGVQQSNSDAVKWYIRAANNGSEIARFTLLKMHEEGRASKEEVDQVFANAEPDTAPTNWLDGLAADQYLLQLMGSSSEQGLRDYAEKHLADVQPTPQLVKARNKDKDWYILLMGPFDNSQGAQQTLGKLPEKVRANKPWPRSVASVRISLEHPPTP